MVFQARIQTGIHPFISGPLVGVLERMADNFPEGTGLLADLVRDVRIELTLISL